MRLEDLPLADLYRWMRNKWELARDMVPPESVPVFGLHKGQMAVELNNIGDITLGAAASWASLPSPGPVSGTVETSGLSDLWLWAGGTVARSGATTIHVLSFLVNGVEYNTLVHEAAASSWGLFTLDSALNRGWAMMGRVPASLLPRGETSIEIVYKRTTGSNTGLIGGSSAFTINLYANEY